MASSEIKNLYYIAHVDNIASIIEKGILSRQKVEEEKVGYLDISAKDIVDKRKNKETPTGEILNLWEYANLYYNARNPMMYAISDAGSKISDFAVVSVDKTVLYDHGVIITDGNAVAKQTNFYNLPDGLKVLKRQWKVINNEWWNSHDGSKRKIMAECLVPNRVDREHIDSIYVANAHIKNKIEKEIEKETWDYETPTIEPKIPIIPEPFMFFQSDSPIKIGKNIELVEGDMFFSNLQALTISVNLQGVMGKGLASRAKYQFPDVYVAYQDACRSRRITATKPYLYKRESSLYEELADYAERSLKRSGDDSTPPNAETWFLLFATKRKWRENSRLDDIKAGLEWVRHNFKKEGIQSLAMPALGCGLGGLDWKIVGPVMCRALHGIGIPVEIYLPRERETEDEYLKARHLLRA